MRQIDEATEFVTILLVFKTGETHQIRIPKDSVDHFCAGAEIALVHIASL